MDDLELPREGMARIDVTGRTPALWRDMRPKLLQAINEVLDKVVDPVKGTTLREEAQQLLAAGLGNIKVRLAKAGLENEKIEAEVAKTYAEQEKLLAEARKANSEAEAREFQTAVQRLRLVLGGTKAMLIGDTDEEALLFGRQIDAFLEVLKDVAKA